MSAVASIQSLTPFSSVPRGIRGTRFKHIAHVQVVVRLCYQIILHSPSILLLLALQAASKDVPVMPCGLGNNDKYHSFILLCGGP